MVLQNCSASQSEAMLVKQMENADRIYASKTDICQAEEETTSSSHIKLFISNMYFLASMIILYRFISILYSQLT
jgi:hypothetical protein